MQGAPVQPGDQQRPLIAEGAVDVGCREALAAGADGEPGAARVLTLHGQQALGDGDGIWQRWAGQAL
jgi:hypothetical protein